MQRRQPSSALAPTDRSSIRRRSGALSPNPDYLGPDSPLLCQEQIEELPDSRLPDHGFDDEPTVYLVRSLAPSPLLPSLPSFAVHTTDVPVSSTPTKAPPACDHAPFSSIPLTPRPDAPSRPGSELSYHTHTSAPSISRLPTPDYTTQRQTDHSLAFRSFFPRDLSFLPFHHRPSVSSLSPSAKSLTSFITKNPRTLRRSGSNNSESTVRSTSSACTSSSVDSGRRLLIPPIGTTDKFTHKWPKPRSVRNLSGKRAVDTVMGGGAAATALEEGKGLGMNRIERWSGYKWCLMLSVSTVFVYGAAGLACAILTWFRTWEQADVMYVADYDILVLITLSSSILLFVALVGITGALLNSRPILAVYTLLLWPAFISMLAIGYTSYRRATFSLDRKLNLAWSQYYTPLGRLLIQNTLKCCGFYDALHEATLSKRCYSRMQLPGCKGKLYRFEAENLALVWSVTFSLVPLHIMNIVVALLTANHMTNTFGKGITPKRYRLSGMDVRKDAERLFGRVEVPVMRPDMSRAPSSRVFREDREDRLVLLEHM